MSTYNPEEEPDVTGVAHAPDPVAALDDSGIGTMSSAEPFVGEDDAPDGDPPDGDGYDER